MEIEKFDKASRILHEKLYFERIKMDLQNANSIDRISDILEGSSIKTKMPSIEKIKIDAMIEIDKQIKYFETEFEKL